mmetsp:Transcript_17127/g.59576  ORF Transcript_17127/g.59576 Transcript_17127/m.59576 type:complete len:267 (-) Transcript_17127:132-932(-)
MGPALLGLFVQGDDDHLEVEERRVDVLGLAQRDAVGLGLVRPLRPSQIHHVQLRPQHHVRTDLAAFDEDGEDAVRPRRGLVHRRRRDGAVRVAEEEQVQCVLFALGAVEAEVAEVEVAVGVFHHLHALHVRLRLGLVARVQQVKALLVVNLHVRDVRRPLRTRPRTELCEDEPDGPRDDAAVLVPLRAARDRKRLARARLAVRKDRRIVAVERVHDHALADPVEDLLLVNVHGQNVVELEPVLGARVVDVVGDALFLLLRDVPLDH